MGRLRTLGLPFALALGCEGGAPAQGPRPDPGGTPPESACGLEVCPACFEGTACASAGPSLPGTCCASGDALVHLGTGVAAEAVDIEVDGDLALLCGGFGAWINDVANPAEPRSLGTVSARCQRAAFGPTLADGTRVFYLAHHGDSWVPAPSLETYHLAPEEDLPIQKDSQTAFGLPFEGLAHRDSHLYAAAHDQGLRVYETDAEGLPTFVGALDGFENATKLALDGDLLYVADNEGGLVIVSIAEPGEPDVLSATATLGFARDVAVEGERAYVALGGSGLDVFDVSDPVGPNLVAHLDGVGSVQAVDVDEGALALASWSHVRVHDAESLALLATDQTRPYPEFEQNLGLAIAQDVLYVAEWEALHTFRYQPGLVAPDLEVVGEFSSFAAERADDRVLVLRNRGALELVVDRIETTDAAYEVDPTPLRVPPGEAAAIEVHYEPPAPAFGATLLMETNDPDPDDAVFRMPLVAQSSENLLDVGDPLTDSFAFLDPGGQNQLGGLEGHVTVLAYFALF